MPGSQFPDEETKSIGKFSFNVENNLNKVPGGAFLLVTDKVSVI